MFDLKKFEVDYEYVNTIQPKLEEDPPDYEWASFFARLHAEDLYRQNNEDFYQWLQLSNYIKLLYAKYQKNATSVKISNRLVAHPCQFCRDHNNDIFTIEEAFNEMPLPHKECTNGLLNEGLTLAIGFCQCYYDKPEV